MLLLMFDHLQVYCFQRNFHPKQYVQLRCALTSSAVNLVLDWVGPKYDEKLQHQKKQLQNGDGQALQS